MKTAPLDLATTFPDKATPVVTARGDVDLFTAPALLAEVERALSLGHRRLVLDLTGVPFMDSAGVALLISVYRRLRECGGWMALAGTQGHVARTLQITRVGTLFGLYPTAAEALAGEGGGQSGAAHEARPAAGA